MSNLVRPDPIRLRHRMRKTLRCASLLFRFATGIPARTWWQARVQRNAGLVSAWQRLLKRALCLIQLLARSAFRSQANSERQLGLPRESSDLAFLAKWVQDSYFLVEESEFWVGRGVDRVAYQVHWVITDWLCDFRSPRISKFGNTDRLTFCRFINSKRKRGPYSCTRLRFGL